MNWLGIKKICKFTNSIPDNSHLCHRIIGIKITTGITFGDIIQINVNACNLIVELFPIGSIWRVV